VSDSPAGRFAAHAGELLAAGRRDQAIAECRRALELEPDCLEAHVCLARAKRPGDDYLVWLRRFHELLRPSIYLEIGVDVGRTLRLARPPTLAIGVDPSPPPAATFAAETHLFGITSDEFFRSAAGTELGERPVDLAFVDGLHLFEQALKDFIHLERHAARGSVVLFHDCLPIDAPTASRERATGFWTGDVWKILPILAEHRPDLEVFVIPAYPTGLAVVTRMDPSSAVLEERFDSIVVGRRGAQWNEAAEARVPAVPNDERSVLARLAAAR
jgi:hypothetical protein